MKTDSETDKKWMRAALRLAHRSAKLGEVPVGAVLVGPDGVISWGANRRETLHTPLGHAELMALHRGSKVRNNWRLEDTTLYVTLEPCIMCAGAILQARVSRVVYAAKDPRGGAVESLYQTFADPRLNHQVSFTSGLLESESTELLQHFFKTRREEHRLQKQAKTYRSRASAVVIHQGRILGFHAVDPTSQRNYFFLPGGKIELSETPQECAVRETFEETGYRISLAPGLELRKRYDFEWDGKIHHCETLFYIGFLAEPWHEPGPVQDAAYHRGVQWVESKKSNEIFAYDANILWGVQWALKNERRYSRTSKR